MTEFTNFFSKETPGSSSPAPSYLVRSWPGTGALKNDDGGVYHRHQGTIKQAVMLGLAATISHTAGSG